MGHISGEDRSQLLLLPDAVDDYVGPDNPVRFIDAFVDSLDLEETGFQRVRPNDKGRPGYDPADLLKLYIYGYLNRVRSSRRLEVETHRNLEVIWLLRQLRPDFKTIADFRRDNRSAFRQVFREFVRLCRELDLYGRELIAVDGTRIKAVNNRDRNFTRATLKRDLQRIDDQLERYLEQMNEADANAASGGGNSVADLQDKIASIRKRKETLEGHRQKLDETGEAQLSLTDPDSRSMHSGTRVGVGYNVQLAVDSKHNLIAEQQVHSKVSDLGLLAETATAARQNLAVDEIDAVADGGYYKIEDMEDCEAGGITPFVPKPDRSPATRDQSRGTSHDDRRGSRLNPYFARFQGDNQPKSGRQAIAAVPHATDTTDAPTDRRRRREPATVLKPRCCRISDPRLGLFTRSGSCATLPSGITVQSAPIQGARIFSPLARATGPAAGGESDVEEGRRLRGDLDFQAGAPGVRDVEDNP